MNWAFYINHSTFFVVWLFWKIHTLWLGLPETIGVAGLCGFESCETLELVSQKVLETVDSR